MLRQEALLRRALSERGHLSPQTSIEVDHISGSAEVDGLRVGLVHPDSYFARGRRLWSRRRRYHYFFKGHISSSGGREKMLSAFQNVSNSKIVSSDAGRWKWLKGNFDWFYFSQLGKSKFGLCPNQADWPGDFFWTYRFVDCLLAGAIPVLFRLTPLSDDFVAGFFFVWDDSLQSEISETKRIKMAEHNYQLALSRFRLPECPNE